MKEVLKSFATAYRKSAVSRRDGVKDFLIDYEKFLREAGLADGDTRETAEQELTTAEKISGGLFVIDRQPRSGSPLRLRLAREGGEAWLFEQTGEAAPAAGRELLAEFFEKAAAAPVKAMWQESWRRWCKGLAAAARAGDSLQPFRRDDPAGNDELLDVLRKLLDWEGESLIRYASAAICGDSKRLQVLEPRLLPALVAVTGFSSLADFGIHRKPRAVTFHGPVIITTAAGVFDFSLLPGPVTLSESNLLPPAALTSTAPLCLTVENEDVFHELVRARTGALLVQTSYPGSAALRFLRMLPAELPWHHFGDSDPAGSDILRDLRERTGRRIEPLLMQHRPSASSRDLTAEDCRKLQQLLESDLVRDQHEHFRAMLASGKKGVFEQEFIPIAEVLEALRSLLFQGEEH